MHALLDIAAGAATCGLLVGGYAYAANWPTSQIFGRTLVSVPDAGPQHSVALTYDDGPSSRNTPALLDLLAEFNVRATFFLIGEHVRKHPDLAQRVAAAGHAIGNHTTMHPNMARQSAQRVQDEIARCQATIIDAVGVTPILFRPPYGARTPGVLRAARRAGLTPVMWNVTAHDWDNHGVPFVQKLVDTGIARNRKRKRTSNILLHDASHLDGAAPASREDTIAVTRNLLQRSDLQFTTPLEWLHP